MNGRPFFSSLTRISDLDETAFEVRRLERSRWGSGDYVVAEVESRDAEMGMELQSGRRIELAEGDRVVGPLGDRYATLEATGSWKEVGDDGRMEILSGGGMLGRLTSKSMMLPPMTRVRYVGHVIRGGKPVRMTDFVTAPRDERTYDHPTILVIGTSMSAGKTTAARVVIRRLKARGFRVLGAKVTGAGRYRDVLSMSDAGADVIYDFVDAGLPSTVVPEDEYRDGLRILLSKMAAATVDAAVVEVGASPLEPYNGDVAVEKLHESVRMCVLCASDPYAVLGVQEAFGVEPDLVTGVASNTRAGIALVEELTGLKTLNVRDADALPELDRLLEAHLDLPEAPAGNETGPAG